MNWSIEYAPLIPVNVLIILTLSSLYEIVESWAARLVDPGVGMAFVGAQGDVWDG